MTRTLGACAAIAALMSCSDPKGDDDDGSIDADTAGSVDAQSGADAPVSIDAPGDTADAASVIDYDCGIFTEDPGWTVMTGFRAVVVADATDGLNQPVAISLAQGAFGGLAYVVNGGDGQLMAVDTLTGTTTPFVAAAAWPVTPSLLTTSVWDSTGEFDGNLYIGDQGGDGDADSRIYRVTSTGATSLFTTAPGAGLDDIYGMVFSPGGAYPGGMYVTGDTDGGGVDWGVFDAAGVGASFSELAGGEGIAVDRMGAYGGGLFASRPAGGGYSGDDTISRVLSDGLNGTPVATAIPGIHAVTFARPGAFSGTMAAASWQTGRLIAIAPDGTVTDMATGLSLTNYDGNILQFSPDGNVLFVADRLANRLVCIEPL